MTRVGINGFGRMGRLALRAGWGRDGLDSSTSSLRDAASLWVPMASQDCAKSPRRTSFGQRDRDLAVRAGQGNPTP
jgi:hypothetical protein